MKEDIEIEESVNQRMSDHLRKSFPVLDL